jgi:hypothetical protein
MPTRGCERGKGADAWRQRIRLSVSPDVGIGPRMEEMTVKWTRAEHHLEALTQTCAEMATRPRSMFSLRVVQLWAVGDILSAVRDVETVTVALAVDLPVCDVPWLSEPPGCQHWASATHPAKNPVIALWRSAYAPIWNHHIDRPRSAVGLGKGSGPGDAGGAETGVG